MPKIVFVDADGSQELVDAPVGTTLMRAATAAGIDGIVAECGGNAMCATCHVYVEAEFLPDLDQVEDELLEATASERRPTSRLSCQLTITDGFEGLVVELPESQE